MLRLKQQWSLHFCAAVAQGSANPDWVCCSGQCEQSARPCRRAGVCSISKPPSQIQAFLAPVKLSDNLWAGTVPCKQMDVNGPAAKSLGCSSGRGEREQSSSVLMPRCPSLLRLPWDEQAGEVSGLGTGCFTAEMIPPRSPPDSCYSITEDKVVPEMLSAWAPLSLGTAVTPHCPFVLQRLTLKAAAQHFLF